MVTSSIKGEGKTVISVNLSSILSLKFQKILLIGADLRNPQIHKFLGIKKETKGLSDYIYRDDINWKDLIKKHQNLDGTLISFRVVPHPSPQNIKK